MDKKIKYAVFLVIKNKEGKTLIVQRPFDDPNIPGVWGLPADYVASNESFEDAAIRAGKNKLGIKIKITGFLGRGNLERENYVLHGEEYEAVIDSGEPSVPQPEGKGTQYVSFRWGELDDVVDAAKDGSLCSNLYLMSNDREPFLEVF